MISSSSDPALLSTEPAFPVCLDASRSLSLIRSSALERIQRIQCGSKQGGIEVTDVIRVILLCVDCSLGIASPPFIPKPSSSQLFTKASNLSLVIDESFRPVRQTLHRKGGIVPQRSAAVTFRQIACTAMQIVSPDVGYTCERSYNKSLELI